LRAFVTDKLTRKEMKAPDALQRAGQDAREWVQGRQRSLAIGIAVAFVGLSGAALVSYLSGKSEAAAAKELGQELQTLARPVDAAPPADAPAENPPFKTEKDKDEAIVKAMTDFRAQHGGTHANASAALPLAQALFRLQKYDESLAAFDDYLKIVPPDDPLRALALEGKGYCFEAKNQLDQALATFDELSRESKTEFMNGMGLYHRARVLIAQGKKTEAAAQLAEIPGSAPNTAAARLAQDRMNLLASQGVIIPPVAKPPSLDAG